MPCLRVVMSSLCEVLARRRGWSVDVEETKVWMLRNSQSWARELTPQSSRVLGLHNPRSVTEQMSRRCNGMDRRGAGEDEEEE